MLSVFKIYGNKKYHKKLKGVPYKQRAVAQQD